MLIYCLDWEEHVGQPIKCDALHSKITKASPVTAEWAGGASAPHLTLSQAGIECTDEKDDKEKQSTCLTPPSAPTFPISQRNDVAKHQPWRCQAGAALFMMLCVVRSQPCPCNLIAHNGRSGKQTKRTPRAFVARDKTSARARWDVNSHKSKLESYTHLLCTSVAVLWCC